VTDHNPKSDDHIKPRIDEHGVGRCVFSCPQATPHPHTNFQVRCRVLVGIPVCDGEVCPVHARRQAERLAKLEAWVAEALERLDPRWDDNLISTCPLREEE